MGSAMSLRAARSVEEDAEIMKRNGNETPADGTARPVRMHVDMLSVAWGPASRQYLERKQGAQRRAGNGVRRSSTAVCSRM
jgi:hypothetical protein